MRRTAFRRGLNALCLVIVCAAASGSAPTYSLIVFSRVQLGPIDDIPANLSYTPVSGLIGDLNGDGAPDIALGMNGVHPAVYFNNGTAHPFEGVSGAFVSPLPDPNTAGISWGAVVLQDVNGDDHPDLSIAGFNAPNLVYLNDGTATPFDNVAGIAIGTQDIGYAPAFGDVNGDGFLDMVIANTNHIASQLYLTQNAPLTSGSYSTVQIGTDLGYGQDAKIADVNGDGKADLILTYLALIVGGTDPSGIVIYLNNSTGDPFNNVTPQRLLLEQSVFAIAVEDVNQDSEPDLVAVNSDPTLSLSPDLLVFLNTDSSTQPFADFQPLITSDNLGGGCISVAVADMNRDALPDLLFSCAAPAPNTDPVPEHPSVGSIYLNNGTPDPFADVVPVDIPAAAFSGYGRSIAVGTLVENGEPNVLIVDGDGLGAYYSTLLDQDPTTQNDAGTCAIDTSVSVDVLANDIAGPGQSLDAGSVTIISEPEHGTAINDLATGAITYEPEPGYSGTDSLRYTVRDKLGATSEPAAVDLRVQPAPVAMNDIASLDADTPIALDVLANDTSDGGMLDSASIVIVVAPTHGTAAVTDGKVRYTPASRYSGLDTFQYSVQDDLGTESNVATVSIEIQDSADGGGGGAIELLELGALAGFALSVRRSRKFRLGRGASR